MPTPLSLVLRRVPWVRVWLMAQWLYKRGRDNLTEAERRELGTLLKKTKGDPRKLNARDRSRVRSLVVKGVTGSKSK